MIHCHKWYICVREREREGGRKEGGRLRFYQAHKHKEFLCLQTCALYQSMVGDMLCIFHPSGMVLLQIVNYIGSSALIFICRPTYFLVKYANFYLSFLWHVDYILSTYKKTKQAWLVFYVTKLFYLFKAKAVFQQSKREGSVSLFYLLFSMKFMVKTVSMNSEDPFCTLCLCGCPQALKASDLLG